MIIIKSGPQIIIDPTSITVSHSLGGDSFVVAATTKDNRIYQVWPFGDTVCTDEREARRIVDYVGNMIYKHCAGSLLYNLYIDLKGVIKSSEKQGEVNGHADT